MASPAGPRVPAALMPMLDGNGLESKVGITFPLITVGETGWPHVALLSVGELLLLSPHRLRMGLWPQSHTTANLRRTQQATLMAVVPPVTHYVRLRCRLVGDIRVGETLRTVFDGVPEEVVKDVVAYAEVTSGMAFTLNDTSGTVSEWNQAVRALRKSDGAD